MALGAFALESFVQRRTEHFPEFLFGLSVQRDRLGFDLPALLQGLDGIHTQSGRSAQLAGFVDQGLAAFDAGFLGGFEAGGSGFENRLPLRLHLAKGFFTQVARIAPAVGELVQGTQLGTPVFAIGVGRRPGFDFVHQGHALGAVVGRLFFHLLEPSQHGFVGFVASGIETLPQRMVGQAALVGLLPAVAQLAQLVLHFAAAHGGGLVGVQQAFSLGHQGLAHLVGQPALPAFGVTRCGQGLVHPLVQGGVQVLAVGFEGRTQSVDPLGQGGALALGDLFFKRFQHFGHGLEGLLAQGLALGRVHFGFGRLGLFGGIARRRHCGGGLNVRHDLAAQTADFIGPHGHRGQGGGGIGLGLLGQRQGGRKTLPDGLQLALRGIELGRELQIHAGPDGVGAELPSLGLPLGDIGLHPRQTGLGLGHGLGREHFDALRQQDGGFALHHHLVLQVFHAFDHFGQTQLQTGQGLAREGCARFGSVALPGHGVANVQARGLQHLLCFLRPVAGQGVLTMLALELVELFLQELGRAFVARGHLAVDLGQGVGSGFGREPFAQTGAALA